jgi:hypothetical protein
VVQDLLIDLQTVDIVNSIPPEVFSSHSHSFPCPFISLSIFGTWIIFFFYSFSLLDEGIFFLKNSTPSNAWIP